VSGSWLYLLDEPIIIIENGYVKYKIAFYKGGNKRSTGKMPVPPEKSLISTPLKIPLQNLFVRHSERGEESRFFGRCAPSE